MKADLEAFIVSNQSFINQAMIEKIQKTTIPTPLKESMLYSIKAGGKRIRPILMIASAEAFGGKKDDVLSAALALEMIHTYSLIHDDLPAMDDDHLRRGQPTNHIQFDEATAILAGDAFLTMAFQIISEDEHLSAEQRIKIINRLSLAAGPSGMVAGQILDFQAENKTISLNEMERIHDLKTGKLLIYAMEIGAYIAGASEMELEAVKTCGQYMGLIFQIQDDILDVQGQESKIGKKVGSDLNNEKSTYPKLLGIEASIKEKDKNVLLAKQVLENANISSSILTHFIDYLSSRDS
ncbi:polyprenyl synthetase family protein [Amphibacillus sp. MSJ-3]|uniref:polyprenyl synthetase family protein n=1 Tax=Amphibacillus sp. MSJ-3 TaxID=2841505 RepID=UPI001C0F1F8D|nr:farnesyl diphosphate synthase [Amphibacillus sp. MSJ-3]MBU5594807.1 polyprenyl synthetase family protein [Amphibacillus sp. MSJ-3]